MEPRIQYAQTKDGVDIAYWTVRTLDGSLSAHFEHTLAIRDGEAEVLTLP